MNKISVGIPAYSRPKELIDLLDSLLEQTTVLHEIILCEDLSPHRDLIRAIASCYFEKFNSIGCRLLYIENSINLGYDANLRKIISNSTGDYIVLMGNDDVLLPNAASEIDGFIESNKGINAISRGILRFEHSIEKPAGISQLSNVNKIYACSLEKSRNIFRLGAFIGGLVFRVDWAKNIETDKYDGGLYYQIYLMAVAFCTTGVGYISTPIVGGRFGNPPLFGNSNTEKSVHIPGSYAPKARAKMWKTVLEIASDIEIKFGVNLLEDIRKDLAGRQYFHIYEMYAGANILKLNEIKNELTRVGVPHSSYAFVFRWVNILFGRYASIFYFAVRKAMQ
jgi:glycosyltransferase involved in cell wall biosynthesis